MSDKMMRIAGRTPSGTAVPMRADADGNVATTRAWKKEWSTIQESIEIRSTEQVKLPAVDVSGIPVFSLRILNRLDVPVSIKLLADINTSNGYSLINNDGTSISLTIQPANSYIAITPEEFPILNYIRYLRIAVTASSAPSSGTFSAYMVSMK